jgi:lincosamide nucleotidyltransferase A/C/D/E
MRAEDVVALYTLLFEQGVQLWVDGGWGIDALLAEQTRPHKDLDALVRCDDLVILVDVLAERGFTLKEIWSENRWVGHLAQVLLIGRATPDGREVATAFVLRNGDSHELDVHALTLDGDGAGIPAWNADQIYPPAALAGHGSILSTPVRCLSAQMQMLTHAGYELQEKDLQDLRSLYERFGIPSLEEQAQRSAGGSR